MLTDSTIQPAQHFPSVNTRTEPNLPIKIADEDSYPARPHPYLRFVNPHLGELLSALRLDKQFVRATGCELYDQHNRRYLDCVAAYGALPFGHNPPAIWNSLRNVESSGEPNFVQPSLLDAAGMLAKQLLAVAPGNLRHVTFTNSGAESVEAAIKLCRAATRRQGILSTKNSFHGKTLAALSATGNPDYHQNFGAPTIDFNSIPFDDAEALRQELADRPEYYAAFIVEPIQGEGGIVVPTAGYLSEIREICSKAGVLLVLDEIQTGLGRTGAMFRCQSEGVEPDVMTVAKALGGGLLPIGAVLCTAKTYSKTFALKHSSTFAGNALACRAGLAALQLLTNDESMLLKRVEVYGQRLKDRLIELQTRYQHLIEEVRGAGLLLGIRFAVNRESWPNSFLGVAAEQDLFTPILSSYMLNVEGVRVAPTLNGNSVIRIEPPLTIRWKECEELLAALERTLTVFAGGDMGLILGSILDGTPRKIKRMNRPTAKATIRPRAKETRFAFLLHPLQCTGYADFDPTLKSLSMTEIEAAAKGLSQLLEPFVLSRTRVTSLTGKSVYGEIVTLPWNAAQLAGMRRKQAILRVQQALTLAQTRGAQIVGLGAFTSVVTRAGLALVDSGVPLTTGNSYTAVASAEAIEKALARLGDAFGRATCATIVGSTGAIGRAMALLLSEKVGRLVLSGNPDSPAPKIRERLLDVSTDVCRHLAIRHAEGQRFAKSTLGQRMLAAAGGELDPDVSDEDLAPIVAQLEQDGVIKLTQDTVRALRHAHVVVTATSATGTLIQSQQLRYGAIVCDLSRPANVSSEVAAERPDVLVIDGGVIAVPGRPELGRFGLDNGLSYACMAETMLLALDGHLEHTSLGTDLTPEGLRFLGSLARQHGFHVAQLRSFGRLLDDDDWVRVADARQTRIPVDYRCVA